MRNRCHQCHQCRLISDPLNCKRTGLAEAAAVWSWGALGKDDATGACIVFNIKRKQLSPHQVEKLVRQTAEADGYDTEIIIEQEPGSRAVFYQVASYPAAAK